MSDVLSVLATVLAFGFRLVESIEKVKENRETRRRVVARISSSLDKLNAAFKGLKNSRISSGVVAAVDKLKLDLETALEHVHRATTEVSSGSRGWGLKQWFYRDTLEATLRGIEDQISRCFQEFSLLSNVRIEKAIAKNNEQVNSKLDELLRRTESGRAQQRATRTRSLILPASFSPSSVPTPRRRSTDIAQPTTRLTTNRLRRLSTGAVLSGTSTTTKSPTLASTSRAASTSATSLQPGSANRIRKLSTDITTTTKSPTVASTSRAASTSATSLQPSSVSPSRMNKSPTVTPRTASTSTTLVQPSTSPSSTRTTIFPNKSSTSTSSTSVASPSRTISPNKSPISPVASTSSSHRSSSATSSSPTRLVSTQRQRSPSVTRQRTPSITRHRSSSRAHEKEQAKDLEQEIRRLRDEGLLNEAVTPARKLVAIRRRILKPSSKSSSRPEQEGAYNIHVAALAYSLNLLSRCLKDALGTNATSREVVDSLKEGSSLYGDLFRNGKDGEYRLEYATTLYNLSVRQSEIARSESTAGKRKMGILEEAEENAEGAVGQFRRLYQNTDKDNANTEAAGGGAQYAPQLINAYINLSYILSDLGRHEKALAIARRALEIASASSCASGVASGIPATGEAAVSASGSIAVTANADGGRDQKEWEGNRDLIHKSLLRVAFCNHNLGRYDEASIAEGEARLLVGG